MILLLLSCVALFLASAFLLFSSFLSDTSEGIRAAVKTYSYWFQTGMTQKTAPWNPYLVWLLREEPVTLFGGTCGTILALVRMCGRAITEC